MPVLLGANGNRRVQRRPQCHLMGCMYCWWCKSGLGALSRTRLS